MGLNGERQVIANISDKLGNEHSLFNDVMPRDGKAGGNIDHIIVGPRGVFVIETKNLQNPISVHGDNWKGLKQSPSMQAKNNARRVLFPSKQPKYSWKTPALSSCYSCLAKWQN